MKTREDLKQGFAFLFVNKDLGNISLVDVKTCAFAISDATYVHLGDFTSLFRCFENFEANDEYEEARLKHNASSAFNTILNNLEEAYEKYKNELPKAEILFAVHVISCCLFLDNKNIFSDEKALAFYPTAKNIVSWCHVFNL